MGIVNVTLRNAQVVALLGSERRVTGVRISTADGEEVELSADLVVDASGRGSRAVHWLGGLGITDIPESIVDSGLVYASRLYRLPEGAEKFPLTQVTADPFASQPGRSANVVPIEGGRWLVSLGRAAAANPRPRPRTSSASRSACATPSWASSSPGPNRSRM